MEHAANVAVVVNILRGMAAVAAALVSSTSQVPVEAASRSRRLEAGAEPHGRGPTGSERARRRRPDRGRQRRVCDRVCKWKEHGDLGGCGPSI